jgi:DNA-binding transcriptional ArsR family regulator
MVKYSSPALDSTFAALSDPIRRGILQRLSQGEATVGELAAPFGVTPPAISHHLRVLEHARLVSHRRQGRTRLCRLRPTGMRAAADWMDQYREFWEPRLDALGEHLAKSKRSRGEEER